MEKILLNKIFQKSQFSDKNAYNSGSAGPILKIFVLLGGPIHGADLCYLWQKMS